MYMKVYEFRKDLKAAFDSALRGEEVQIERGGVSYQLTAFGVIGKVIHAPKIDYSISAPTKNISKPDPLKVVKDLFPKSKVLCKIHGTPLTAEGKCLQKGH